MITRDTLREFLAYSHTGESVPPEQHGYNILSWVITWPLYWAKWAERQAAAKDVDPGENIYGPVGVTRQQRRGSSRPANFLQCNIYGTTFSRVGLSYPGWIAWWSALTYFSWVKIFQNPFINGVAVVKTLNIIVRKGSICFAFFFCK